jgi:hypothetical protein
VAGRQLAGGRVTSTGGRRGGDGSSFRFIRQSVLPGDVSVQVGRPIRPINWGLKTIEGSLRAERILGAGGADGEPLGVGERRGDGVHVSEDSGKEVGCTGDEGELRLAWKKWVKWGRMRPVSFNCGDAKPRSGRFNFTAVSEEVREARRGRSLKMAEKRLTKGEYGVSLQKALRMSKHRRFGGLALASLQFCMVTV